MPTWGQISKPRWATLDRKIIRSIQRGASFRPRTTRRWPARSATAHRASACISNQKSTCSISKQIVRSEHHEIVKNTQNIWRWKTQAVGRRTKRRDKTHRQNHNYWLLVKGEHQMPISTWQLFRQPHFEFATCFIIESSGNLREPKLLQNFFHWAMRSSIFVWGFVVNPCVLFFLASSLSYKETLDFLVSTFTKVICSS